MNKSLIFAALYGGIAEGVLVGGRQSGKTLLADEAVRQASAGGQHVVIVDCETGTVTRHKSCACPRCTNPPRPCKKAREMARYKAEKRRRVNFDSCLPVEGDA